MAVYGVPDLAHLAGLASGSPRNLPDLGISDLPPEVADSRAVAPWLNRLERETCDQEAVGPLANALKAAGQPRQAAQALSSFYFNCKGSTQLLDDAVEILMALSDFDLAYDYADALIKADPAFGRYRYLRGWAAEKLGRNQQSLVDMTNALNLLGDPSRVAGSMFYDVAQAHARLGQFCEAITPIQQWMSYDGARDTPQTQTLLREFTEKGNCGNTYAKVTKAFTLPVKGEVLLAKVSVNGATGTFVIDTGASLVVLTSDFAALAQVPRDPANEITSFTANGATSSILSSAAVVSLGPVEARNVTVGISKQNEFGPGIDGLLGMSFLARFSLSLTPTRFEITASR